MQQLFLNCIFIIAGAAAGALSRYFIVQTLPAPVLIVNLAGSFLIGLAYQKFSASFPQHYIHLISTGFLGALTTFSAFSLEVMVGIKAGKIIEIILYAIASVIACICACFLGYRLKF